MLKQKILKDNSMLNPIEKLRSPIEDGLYPEKNYHSAVMSVHRIISHFDIFIDTVEISSKGGKLPIKDVRQSYP
jgi:hypothetical protein